MEGSKLDRLTHTGFLSFEIPAQIWKTYASVLHSTVLSFWSFRSNFGIFMEFLPNFQFFRQMSAYPYLAWNFWFGPNRQSWQAGLPVFKHMIRAGFDANNAVCACRSKTSSEVSCLSQFSFTLFHSRWKECECLRHYFLNFVQIIFREIEELLK